MNERRISNNKERDEELQMERRTEQEEIDAKLDEAVEESLQKLAEGLKTPQRDLTMLATHSPTENGLWLFSANRKERLPPAKTYPKLLMEAPPDVSTSQISGCFFSTHTGRVGAEENRTTAVQEERRLCGVVIILSNMGRW
jgi:hypothetical protein